MPENDVNIITDHVNEIDCLKIYPLKIDMNTSEKNNLVDVSSENEGWYMAYLTILYFLSTLSLLSLSSQEIPQKKKIYKQEHL